MTIIEAINARHSVRQYLDKTLETAVITELQAEIKACNTESGLHIQLVTNEPKAFDSMMAHYGKFSGVTSYLALVAPTTMNQQKFMLAYSGGKVAAKAGVGFYAKIDLGIVKYHFEVGTGKEGTVWD